jgi:hypothetical protein
MAHKKICLNCRKAFNVTNADRTKINLTCPEYERQPALFNHKFRPPKKSDMKQWELVLFLRANGFVYQHVYTKAISL